MGGSVGPCLPPPLEKIHVFSTFFPRFFSLFFHVFSTFLFLTGAFFFMWGPFRQFFATFSPCAYRGPFWACPPPYKNFCGRPCSGVVGNFSCVTLSWHCGHISYRYRARGVGGGGCLNEWSFIKS